MIFELRMLFSEDVFEFQEEKLQTCSVALRVTP